MNMPQISQQIPQQQQHLTLAPGFITGERSTSRQGSGVVSRQMVRICENSVFFFLICLSRSFGGNNRKPNDIVHHYLSVATLKVSISWSFPHSPKHPETMADVAGNW